MRMRNLATIVLLIIVGAACTPVIKMQAPDKPLEVNMNVKIEHTIRVQVDKQLDNVMKENQDIF